MPQKYLSTDPNAGVPQRGPYLSSEPDAGEAREGESLRGLSAAESFFGSHHQTDESGQPLDQGFLDTHVNPGLQGAAHPTSLSDVTSLLLPNMVPGITNAVRATAGPLVRGAIRAGAAVGDYVSPDIIGMASPRLGRGVEFLQRLRGQLNAKAAGAAPSAPPRLAGKAPTLEGALTDAVNEVRQAPSPKSVSLPGGDTVRASGPAPQAPAPSGPRMGAYSSQPTPASATPPAAVSGAPPAAAPPAPAVSTPARTPTTRGASAIRLTAEESQALQQLVAEGYDEADVVRQIVQQRQAAPMRQPSVPSKATGKPSLNAAESKEYQRLLGRGKSPQEAMTLIEQQRAFQQTKGLPTSEQTRLSVNERNATGRWD